MTFANPQMLWLLLVVPPALAAFFWWAWRQRQQLLTRFIQARLLPGLTVGLSPARQKLRLACLLLAATCLILALARPQWGFDWEEVKQRGLDIVVAIDTSRSMLAEDIAPNRLARAKLAALDLMQQARSDRLGLVAFAGGAFLQCPLTIDDSAFRQSVEALEVGIIPQGGTALSEAIQTAAAAFKEGDSHKALVLFTDGEDQDSGALEAAKKAAAEGLQIFTIGIGSTEGELLRLKDDKGRTDYVRDEQGNVVKSHLNESLLREIAGATQKGFYLPLRGAKTIDTLYAQGLAPLPKTESSEKLVKSYHERYQWPLSLAALLLLFEVLLPERRRGLRPRLAAPAAAAPAKPTLREAVTLLLLLALPVAAFGSPSSALREYKEGQYDQAQKDYEQLLQRKTGDQRLHFNAGTAAYRNRQFEQAAKQFEAALTAPDLKLQEQAYYNRGNTLFYLGESNPDPKSRTKTWEESLKNFESTMKLNPQDADAKYNYDYVKKRLEELKQQQQDKQNQDKDKDKDKDQKNQEQQKQDSKQDQQPDSKDQQNKSQQDQKQDSQQQKDQSQQQKDEQKQKEQQAKDKSQDKKDQPKEQPEAKPSSGESKEKPDEKDQGEQGKTYAAGQMTPQQAKQLLDAQKGEEKILPVKPQGKPVDPNRPIKDW